MISDVLGLLESHHQVKRNLNDKTTLTNFDYETYHPAEEVGFAFEVNVFYTIPIETKAW